tara:strand:- start:1836 stop:2162 length:327 start_codon:yes stop_codon:yes gene_type:complete
MKSLHKLRQLIREKLSSNEYQALIEIHFDNQFTVTEMLDQIRALCGVVIVNAESTETLTDRKQKVLTKVKFFVLNASVGYHIGKMVDKALAINGIYAFRVKKIKAPRK